MASLPPRLGRPEPPWEDRIVYEVDDVRAVVTVLTVAKRSAAYR